MIHVIVSVVTLVVAMVFFVLVAPWVGLVFERYLDWVWRVAARRGWK